MDLFVVIMAGGVGARFWPRSRKRNPKQLIKIFGRNTMLQDTVRRLDGMVEKENIFIITNRIQKLKIKEQLPEIPETNIIDEPFGKNTAACIGLASVIIRGKNPNAVTLILPADHLIQNKEAFKQNIISAAKFAEKSKGLVTIGIVPTRPETGYGYIQINEKVIDKNFHKVNTFAEKPNLATAKRFLKSGDFMWNSGMFIWRIDAILNEIQKYLPDLYDGLLKIQKNLDTPDYYKVLTNVYGQLRNISIDYGIMEHSDNVFLIKGHFDWNDVGSWESVYELAPKDKKGNGVIGDVYLYNTEKSYIFSPEKFTALIGVENLIVINTSDSLLICNRDNAQEVKQIVDYLKMKKRDEIL